MHQSFVTTAPQTWGRVGIAGQCAMLIQLSSQCGGGGFQGFDILYLGKHGSAMYEGHLESS